MKCVLFSVAACTLLLVVGSPMASGQLVVVNPLPAEMQQAFYHLPEGGAAMPLDFYHAGEVVDSVTNQPTGQTFPERMSRYGFLEDAGAELPVGFGTVALDFLGGLRGLSINCAACHVGEIHYQGPAGVSRLRILGGPNLADMRRFSQDTYVSLRHALLHPARLIRLLANTHRLQPETIAAIAEIGLIEDGQFDYRATRPEAQAFLQTVAERLHADEDGPASPTFQFAVRQQPTGGSIPADTEPQFLLAALPRARKRDRQNLAPAPFPLSAPSVDVIRNLTLLFAEVNYFLAQGQFPLTTREGYGRLDAFATIRFLLYPAESVRFPFTAPVSVPHLWGTREKKWLHWNANTNSTLQRNITQSLGMGALAASGGINNVLVPNLVPLESAAERIAAPKWPANIFGALRDDLVQRGERIYEARCAKCHEAGQVDPTSGLIEYPLFSLSETRTDPNYAHNFHRPVGRKPFSQALAESAQNLQDWYFLKRNRLHPVPTATQIEWGGGDARLPAVWRDPLAAGDNAPVYAGLPLRGVWATAPYLHNNSVPTLRDLLKPAIHRPVVFRVGNRNYDPQNIGYAQPSATSTIPILERFDVRDAGNSNTGHDGPAFGADDLTPDEIDSLLEYLKSL